MSVLDQIIFISYVTAMVGVALLFYKKNTNVKAMFSASGQSPWWVSGLSSYMTLFSAGTFVVWGGLAYKHGLVAIAINMASGLAAVLVGFFIASKWKALDIDSPADFIAKRFGSLAVKYYSCVLMFVRIMGSAVAMYALAAVLSPLLGLNSSTGIIAITVISGIVIVAYTLFGGLWAVLMTDVLQFIILTIAVLFTVWLASDHIQQLHTMTTLPERFLEWTSAGYTVWFLAGWCCIHLFMLGAEWAFVQRFMSVPSKRDARKACLLFGGLYIVSPAIWLLPAMLYRTVDANANPEQAYILMSQHLLPIGMVGLVAAAMFSATASMVSSQINVFAAVITTAANKALYNNHANDAQQLQLGRMATLVLGVCIVILAIAIPYLGGAEKIIFSMMSLVVSPLFAPALWGLFSHRISRSAVWLVAATSLSGGFLLKFALAEGGVLANLTLLQGLVEWRESNYRMVDIYVGVVVPVLVLSTLEIKARLQHRYCAPNTLITERNETEHTPADAALPLAVVTGSLFFCALVIGLLAMANPALKQQLLQACGILTLISFAMLKISVKNSAST